MKVACVWHVNAVAWTVQQGWENEEKGIAVEFNLDDFANQGDDIVKAMRQAVDLAKMLVTMRNEGDSIETMDMALRAIAADGGL